MNEQVIIKIMKLYRRRDLNIQSHSQLMLYCNKYTYCYLVYQLN
jgi:hypothetical protein